MIVSPVIGARAEWLYGIFCRAMNFYGNDVVPLRIRLFSSESASSWTRGRTVTTCFLLVCSSRFDNAVFIQRVGRKSLRLVRVKCVLQSEHAESWYRSALLFLHHTRNCAVLVTLCRTDPKTNNESTRFDGSKIFTRTSRNFLFEWGRPRSNASSCGFARDRKRGAAALYWHRFWRFW